MDSFRRQTPKIWPTANHPQEFSVILSSPDPNSPWRETPSAYDQFALELRSQGFRRSAKHLENARKEIFTYRGDPNFQFTTTSPLEREMRELNRRMDVGARWSLEGAESMLWVLFRRRFEHRNQILKEQERSPPG